MVFTIPNCMATTLILLHLSSIPYPGRLKAWDLRIPEGDCEKL